MLACPKLVIPALVASDQWQVQRRHQVLTHMRVPPAARIGTKEPADGVGRLFNQKLRSAAVLYSTVTVMRSDITGVLCGIWVQSPSTSWSVCCPLDKLIVVSVWPLPKWT
jgi:hypothetical protein